MSLIPTTLERIARARVDLRMGLPVILTHEGQAILAMAVETLRQDRLGDLRDLGDVHLTLTSRRAENAKGPRLR